MLKQIYLNQITNFSQKQFKALIIFWFGFTIYILFYILNNIGHINWRIAELVQDAGLMLLIPSAIYLCNLEIKNSYLAVIFSIYCLWLVLIIFRGIDLNITSLRSILINADYGIFIYFAPLILLFPLNINFYKLLFNVIVVFGVFFLLYSFLFMRDLLDRSFENQNVIEYFAKSLGIPCGFILLTYKYHSTKKNIFALIVMIVSLLFSIYKARRGLSFICLSILLSFYFLYLIDTKNKILILYLSVLALLLGALYTTSIYQVNKKGLFGFMYERGDSDTRTGVEVCFYNDMNDKDWLIGKGFKGEYFCPSIDIDRESDYRDLIETGYLQIILKGGIISLVLFLLIAIPAIFLGLFYSKNMLSKASSIWILISLISLYPATVNTFNLHFLIFWMSVGICYSKDIRYLPDSLLKESIKKRFQFIKA